MFIISISGWAVAIFGIAHSAPSEYVDTKGSEVLSDHSNCQYPNRLSNPVNGCDNSDPAHPECMKIGTEECDIVIQEPASIVDDKPVAIEQNIPIVKVCE